MDREMRAHFPQIFLVHYTNVCQATVKMLATDHTNTILDKDEVMNTFSSSLAKIIHFFIYICSRQTLKHVDDIKFVLKFTNHFQYRSNPPNVPHRDHHPAVWPQQFSRNLLHWSIMQETGEGWCMHKL